MRHERGAVLLEVLAALTIFAFAAVSAIELLGQLSDSEQRAHRGETTLADESWLMTAYALLDRRDLDLRLGSRRVGPYAVEVQRPEPSLYRVAIGDSVAPDLVTLIYRPVPDDGPH